MALWKGSLELQPDPGYPVFNYTDRVTCEMRWNGTYDACLAWRPGSGALMPGFANLLVDRATVSKGPGGSGVLIVEMSDEDANEDTGAGGKPIYELVWIEQRIPLQLHPIWADVESSATRITNEQWHEIQAWRDTQDPGLKAAYQFSVINYDGSPITGFLATDGGSRNFADRIARGETSYLDCYPVAMTTTFSRNVVQGKPCPRILANPLFEACPEGYSWMRTQHRITRTGRRGKWVIVQQATGSATPWDPLIYAEETP